MRKITREKKSYIWTYFVVDRTYTGPHKCRVLCTLCQKTERPFELELKDGSTSLQRYHLKETHKITDGQAQETKIFPLKRMFESQITGLFRNSSLHLLFNYRSREPSKSDRFCISKNAY